MIESECLYSLINIKVTLYDKSKYRTGYPLYTYLCTPDLKKKQICNL